jgi:ADP-ribose pyrophosphatase YjhB (NUDIX family)
VDRINICLKTKEGTFNYRVGGIIIDSGKILMAKNSGQPFYYTVGGRVNFGESAHEAVLREAYEETKINFEIDRLVFIHENFFIWELENEPFHEISFFFLLTADNILNQLKSNKFNEDYGDVALHWLTITELEKYQLYPEFFKTELLKPLNELKHFMTRNGKTSLIV